MGNRFYSSSWVSHFLWSVYDFLGPVADDEQRIGAVRDELLVSAVLASARKAPTSLSGTTRFPLEWTVHIATFRFGWGNFDGVSVDIWAAKGGSFITTVSEYDGHTPRYFILSLVIV